MILIDFHAVAFRTILNQKINTEEDFIRHIILNTIRSYRKKFKSKYGELVICCDSGKPWRREYFEYYKANRTQNVKNSSLDWNNIYNITNALIDDLKEHFPYKVIQIDNCEADDIIGAICQNVRNVPIMICSSDKDFIQLQTNSKVSQYSLKSKKLMKEESPKKFLFELICRGDTSDGIPNILSDDDVLVRENGRQKPLNKKSIEKWYQSKDLENDMDNDTFSRFTRNRKMIDLKETPEEYQDLTLKILAKQIPVSDSKVLPYLISKKCKSLIKDLNDFI